MESSFVSQSASETKMAPTPTSELGLEELHSSEQHSSGKFRGRLYSKLCTLNLNGARCISVDVFDTLLYRKPVSERRRFYLAAKKFVQLCGHKPMPSVQTVSSARNEANQWAYHSIDTLAYDAETKLFDIFERQLLLLGLPSDLLPLLMQAEVEVEKSVLTPNRSLIHWLRLQRSRQYAVIAISDTPMSSESLQDVIDAVAGPGAVDRLYTSADLCLSKRNGDIFAAVAALEGISTSQMFHLGDSKHSDVVKAKQAGATGTHLPRTRAFIAKRKFDGALFEINRWKTSQRIPLSEVSVDTAGEGSYAFGRTILGPIFAQYCMRLWLYLSFAGKSDNDAVALFCARGGLYLRTIFEAFLQTLDLPLSVTRSDLMISRLVAVRAALLKGSPSAFDEIAREFSDVTMADIARAIAQLDIQFEAEWERPFDRVTFLELMETTKAGTNFRNRLAEQNSMFEVHLESLSANKTRLILCDTGLYGSTLRMLKGGFPERQWECLLFARCNYKGFEAEHFAQTRGLISNHDRYDPTQPASTLLRYWQLFEHVLEPDLQSVKTFTRTPEGTVVANLQSEDWEQRLASSRPPFLVGILDYIQTLPPESWFEKVCSDEPKSWLDLKSAVIYPRSADVRTLDIGVRSHDFGRDEKYQTLPPGKRVSIKQKLKELSGSRWKEGYAAQELGALRLLAHAAIESFFILRWVRSCAFRLVKI